MNKLKLIIGIVVSLLALSGCHATPTKYHWGGYNKHLYKYYDRSIKTEELYQRLHDTIREAESTGKTVPPGLYAECGYLQYENGHFQEAITLFQKEHDKWSESRFLMKKMINNCNAKLNPKHESSNEGVSGNDKSN